jgi:tripeptide aminopeptidase
MMPSDTDRNLRTGLQELLATLVGIPSVSGHEDDLRAFLAARLVTLGLAPEVDAAGNLLAAVPGSGEPLLLNAHMDRVPPGRGHVPRIVRGRMVSDGTTNLGADDAAGIAVVLLAVEEVIQRDLPHPPLVLLFTVGEEVGLRGAGAFDPAPWHVHQGIVFDNAGAAGDVVTRASTYIAFDATLRGTGGHPGKNLDSTLSAIELFRDVALPLGEWDDGKSRVSIGTIQGGTARNAIPSEVHVAGEIRTLVEGSQLDALLVDVERRFTAAAARLGGSAKCAFEPHGAGYRIPPDEPLLLAWRTAWQSRGDAEARAITSFIGSDTNALRQRLRVFTVSTGVEHEHTTRESIALAPLYDLMLATLALLERACVPIQPAPKPQEPQP